MEPVHSAGVLLTIAVAAVALLLVLIMAVKLHAFVALVLVSVVTAAAAGIPVFDADEDVLDIPTALTSGFAGTLGNVALLVGFGVMIGRLLEATGGAQVLADTLINRFGEKRAPLALGVAALIFGFPIFFDAGLVIFLPIIFTVARRFGGSILRYGLPTAGAFASMHAVVVPHPGPVAAVEQLGGEMGITLLMGIPVAVVGWILGAYIVGLQLGNRINVSVADTLFGKMNGGSADDSDTDGAGDSDGGGKAGTTTAAKTTTTPAFGTVLALLLLPLVLISMNTVANTLITAGTISADAWWAGVLLLLGQTPIALLITVVATLFTLFRGRFTLAEGNKLMDDALGPVCAVILITGAGGMFGSVLRSSGIGGALTDLLGDLGLPIMLQAFLIATALRVAQGSATVALTTTAGLIAGQVAADGLSGPQIALLVFTIAAGSTVLSHVNDSGFWLVSRFFGMDVKTTLKTWTVMETTLGLAIFGIAWAL